MEEDNFYKKSTEDDNSESDNNLSTILPDQSKINLEVLDTLPRKKNTTYLIIFFSKLQKTALKSKKRNGFEGTANKPYK